MIEQWYLANIALLAQLFGQVSFDDNYFTWVKIPMFDLPPVFFQANTSLLILTPGFNIDNHVDYHFFVDQKLKRRDGIAPPFIHEDNECNNLYQLGYARLSFHLESFRPSADIVSGDNLPELSKAVYHFLGQQPE